MSIIFLVIGLALGYTMSLWIRNATTPELEEPPVNVVNGVVLPIPDDPRWHRIACHEKCNCIYWHTFQLGKIIVHEGCVRYRRNITVNNAVLYSVDMQDAGIHPYYKAIRKAYVARYAQASIEGTEEQKLLP